MVEDKVVHLLNVLKDVNEDELVQKLNKIKENNDSHISHLFLEEYFKNKDAYVSPEVYRHEAQCIVNIFPQYSVEYVRSMLEILGNENNRVIIILRQLLKNEPIRNRQLLLNTEPIKNVLNKCTSTKSLTLPNSTINSNIVNVAAQPSTSQGVIHPNYFVQQKNTLTLNSKPATMIPKRKVPDPQLGTLKMKIKRIDSTYSVQEPVTDMPYIIGFKPESYTPTNIEENSHLNVKLPPNNIPLDIPDRPIWSKNILCPEKNYNTPKINADPNVESAKVEIPPSLEDLIVGVPESNDYPQTRMSSVENWLNGILPLPNTKKEPTQGPNVNSLNDILSPQQYIKPEATTVQEQNIFSLNNFGIAPVPQLNTRKPDAQQNQRIFGFSNVSVLPQNDAPTADKNEADRFNYIGAVPMPRHNKRKPDAKQNQRILGFSNISALPKNDTPAADKNEADLVNEVLLLEEMGNFTNTVQASKNMMAPGLNVLHAAANKIEGREPQLPTNFMQNVPVAKTERTPKMNNDPEYPWNLPERRFNFLDDDMDADDDADMFEISSGNEEVEEYIDIDKIGEVMNIKQPDIVDEKLVSKIMEIFPDALPAHIRKICSGRKSTTSDIDDIVQLLLSNENYPKRTKKEASPEPDLDLEEQITLLKEILPDADPNYLQYHAELYIQDKDKLKEFMSNALELKNYPTLKDYTRKQQISAQVKQYTTDFNVEKFLEVIQDPETYFNDPKTKTSIYDKYKTDILCLHYVTRFLKNHYSNIAVKTISSVMTKHSHHLTAIVKELDSYVDTGKYLMKSRRKPVPVDSTIQNIPLLQEIAYITHRPEIKQYLEEKETKEKQEKEIAKQNGLLNTCGCCYDDEVMIKDIVNCQNGCDFCKNCVKTSVEILFGEGKLDYPCLQSCGSFFNLQTLKLVLSPKLFSKMAQKKQLEEVKAAGIEELETCPFCDFATIPAPGDKLFKCLNPDCMKESCRECKEPSHIPLRCDEIEKDDDVKNRVYIENKMTEALIRVCYKCGMKFIKADGCNKMTCSCGAKMCYVCGKPVEDYKHFNGQGGDKYHLCPLYSDTNKLHQDAVVKGAEQAKVEIGVAADPKKLKIDPTLDLHQHYKSKSKTNNAIHQGMDENLRLVRALNQHRRLIAIQRHIYRHHHRHHNLHDFNPNEDRV